MAEAGYENTRNGFFKHLIEGRVSFNAWGLHLALRFFSRQGVAHESAASLAATLGLEVRNVRRWLVELDKKGYIVRFHVQGRRGNYAMVIDKYEIKRGSELFRLNASQTRDWRKPVWDLCSESDSESVSEVGSDVVGEVSPTPLRTTHHSPRTTQRKEHRAIARRMICFLNEKAGHHYPSEGKRAESNVVIIAARLADGATEQDCKSVIARKVREWGENPKMNKNLTPSTLFRKSNFWNYHGQLGTDAGLDLEHLR